MEITHPFLVNKSPLISWWSCSFINAKIKGVPGVPLGLFWIYQQSNLFVKKNKHILKCYSQAGRRWPMQRRKVCNDFVQGKRVLARLYLIALPATNNIKGSTPKKAEILLQKIFQVVQRVH
jgi:hypothetical protein